jgi:hypothetical protein
MKAGGSFVFLGLDLTINTNPVAGFVLKRFSYGEWWLIRAKWPVGRAV